MQARPEETVLMLVATSTFLKTSIALCSLFETAPRRARSVRVLLIVVFCISRSLDLDHPREADLFDKKHARYPQIRAMIAWWNIIAKTVAMYLTHIEQGILYDPVVFYRDDFCQCTPADAPGVYARDALKRAGGEVEWGSMVHAVDRHHVRPLFHHELVNLRRTKKDSTGGKVGVRMRIKRRYKSHAANLEWQGLTAQNKQYMRQGGAPTLLVLLARIPCPRRDPHTFPSLQLPFKAIF